MSALLLAVADAPRPLFGNQWLALLVILAGTAALMVLVAAAGRWLAATHPEPVKRTPALAGVPAASATPAPETVAVIAASVAMHLGSQARIMAIRPAAPPNVETLMQQWSLEGRRQIYSSHQIR